jgi:hypothetical protein
MVRASLSITYLNILNCFQIVKTLCAIRYAPCGVSLPRHIICKDPKRGTERIHSDQPPAARVYFGGRSTRSLGAAGTVYQRHREDSLKVEAAPYAIQVTDPRKTKIIIS